MSFSVAESQQQQKYASLNGNIAIEQPFIQRNNGVTVPERERAKECIDQNQCPNPFTSSTTRDPRYDKDKSVNISVSRSPPAPLCHSRSSRERTPTRPQLRTNNSA